MENTTTNEKENTFLIFCLNQTNFALKIDDIAEVIQTPEINRLDNLPSNIYGIYNLRGKAIPVLNIKHILNIPYNDLSQANYIIIINNQDEKFGILVDEYSKILKMSSEQMTSLMKNSISTVSDDSEAIINYNGMIITILHCSELNIELRKYLSETKYSLPEIETEDIIYDRTVERKIFCFYCDKQEFAIDIGFIQEVIEFRSMTKVFNTPDFIVGIINLRGKILPVIDIRFFFNTTKTKINENSRLIVIEVFGIMCCMLADNISFVRTINEQDILEIPESFTNLNKKYIDGLYQITEKTIMIIDLNEIFNDEEMTSLWKN